MHPPRGRGGRAQRREAASIRPMRELTTPIACAVALVGSVTAGLAMPEASWSPRTVEPVARPERIISLALPADEIVLALVEPARILALEAFVDDPTASNATLEARAVAGRMHQPIVAEAILAAEPDLVILPGWSDPQIGALLAHQGVPVHRMGFPASLAEVRHEIRGLGSALGELDGAEALIRAMDARLEAVQRRGGERKSRPSVLLGAWADQTPARGTVFCELVELAGGRCAAAEAGYEGHAMVPLEHLLALDPDIFVENQYRADARARELVPRRGPSADPRYRTLRAVREGRVVEIPSAHLLATSHHVAALAEDLARAMEAP